jgi:hypothetical protein
LRLLSLGKLTSVFSTCSELHETTDAVWFQAPEDWTDDEDARKWFTAMAAGSKGGRAMRKPSALRWQSRVETAKDEDEFKRVTLQLSHFFQQLIVFVFFLGR